MRRAAGRLLRAAMLALTLLLVMSPTSVVVASPPTTEPPIETTTTTTTLPLPSTLPESPCTSPISVTEWASCETAQATALASGALWMLVLLVVALVVLYALRGPRRGL